MGAPAGGEAPSVEAKMRIAAMAATGAMPAAVRAVNATLPRVAVVAAAGSGPATRTMTMPTTMSRTMGLALKLLRILFIDSANPILVSTSDAAKAKSTVAPTAT